MMALSDHKYFFYHENLKMLLFGIKTTPRVVYKVRALSSTCTIQYCTYFSGSLTPPAGHSTVQSSHMIIVMNAIYVSSTIYLQYDCEDPKRPWIDANLTLGFISLPEGVSE